MRLFLLSFLVASACATAPKNAEDTAKKSADGSAAAAETKVDKNTLRIFHTSDEHGWFEGRFSKSHDARYGGFEVLQRFLKDHGFARDLDVLVSSGDSWTGPAFSTLLQGEPMVKAMNYLGYRAVAMGNHEFDFGLDVLRTNVKNSSFSYLASNMSVPSDKQLPIKSHIVVDSAGFKLGIIGLIYRETEKVTLAANVSGFVFKDYVATALARRS